jgi:hypothetical protein
MLGFFWQDLRLAARIETFYSPLIDRLQAIPGISRADVSTGLPLLRVNAMEFGIAGRAADDASRPSDVPCGHGGILRHVRRARGHGERAVRRSVPWRAVLIVTRMAPCCVRARRASAPSIAAQRQA